MENFGGVKFFDCRNNISTHSCLYFSNKLFSYNVQGNAMRFCYYTPRKLFIKKSITNYPTLSAVVVIKLFIHRNYKVRMS